MDTVHSQKIIAVLPAYNAARTLVAFLGKLPPKVFDEVILVDDCSTDGTYELAKKQKRIRLYQTPRNLGYGGNLKLCLTLALAHGADIIVELHPDGEYGTDGIIPALHEVKRGAVIVLGNRFADRQNHFPRGMIFSKYAVTRLLTWIDNVVLCTRIPDLHQGFRVYTRTLLDRVNWRVTSDDFLFSFEIICQAVCTGAVITSVPVTAQYSGKKRGATWGHSIRYTLGTWWVLGRFILAKAGIRGPLFGLRQKEAPCPVCGTSALAQQRLHAGPYTVYFCHICRNGFTWPYTSHSRTLYEPGYYRTPGVLGYMKDIIFSLAQKRRVRWLMSTVYEGNVLDVGSGGGRFGQHIGVCYRVTNIDPYYQGGNPRVLRQDFLTWKTPKRYDAVVFWESLEHTPNPDAYIARAARLLTPGGILCIEYPRWNSVEAVLFGTHWFHLDIPRHRMHFSDQGIAYIVAKHTLTIQRQHGVFALEYAPLGLLFSLLDACGLERFRNIFLPLGIFLLPLTFLELCIGQSPIGLLIAQKGATMKRQL